MPKGIPTTGKRASGGGRKKKYNSELVQRWIPKDVADKLDNIYMFLVDIDSEITKWENTCENKKTSPRYDQAKKLTMVVRERIDSLGIDINSIYSKSEE